MKRSTSDLPGIGWREWVGLPDLGIASIKAKVDTGARSSSLPAFALPAFERDGTTRVRFQVHPVQRNSHETVDVEAKVLDFRARSTPDVAEAHGHREIARLLRSEQYRMEYFE